MCVSPVPPHAFALVVVAQLCTSVAALTDGLPVWHPVETALGTVKVREFGPHDGPLVLCIHGMMDNDYIRSEWNAVAEGLAKEGFHVILPDFHSGPAELRPGAMTGDRMRHVVDDLIHL